MLAACGSEEPRDDGSLAIGMTEPNPAFLAPSGHPDFERWRPELAELAPTYYRLLVEWEPASRPDGSYDPTAEQGGCLRTIPPCSGWHGIRAQLEAVARAQRAAPGRYQLMVVLLYTPEAHAQPPTGCEKRSTTFVSRPPRDLEAYREVLRTVQAEADRAGVEIEYWSPWNEPNHPYFISPQRTGCDADAPSAALGAYVELARAMQQELRPGQQLVLGELAATFRHGPQSTRMVEFVTGVPRDLVCAAPVFGIHQYRDENPLPALIEALDAHGCEREHRIWITETGSKSDRYTPDEACRRDRANLLRWYAHPRVDAAFHYTLREDDVFPTGLVTTDLSTAYPALAEWQAWGAREDPAEPPPESAC